MSELYRRPTAPQKSPITNATSAATADGQTPAEEMIPVNGFAQVVALLQHADPEFRESLLRRIAGRDRKLANNLRAELDES